MRRRAGTLRGMTRFRGVLVVLAIGGMLFIGMAVQVARDRAHQLPLGTGTMGQHRPPGK